jgi:hypothetical protein
VSEITSGVVTVLLAIIGVAIIAVLVSGRAQTASVLQAGGQATGNILNAAISPVTGTGPGFSGGALGIY